MSSCVSDSHMFPIVARVTPQIFFLSLGITNSTLNLASSEIKTLPVLIIIQMRVLYVLIISDEMKLQGKLNIWKN